MNKTYLGFLFGLFAALANALNPIFIKWASSVPSETMVFIRFLVGLIFVLPGLFRKKVVFHAKYLGKHMWRALAGMAGIVCFFYSVKYLPLVDAVTLQNTTPLFMPIIVFFAKKLVIPKMEVFGLVLGFLGVLFILRPGTDLRYLACGIAILGGLFSALGQLGIRGLSKVETLETMMLYYFLISTIVSIPPMIFAWQPIEEPILWVWLVCIGIASVALQYFKTKSLIYAPATKVGVMMYLGVIFGGFFGWWLFDEIPSYWAIGGIALIIAGSFLALFSKEKARKWGERRSYTNPSK